MLGGGAAVGALLWRVLMLDTTPRAARLSPERLSQQDRQALDGLLHDRSPRP
jgi:hypothetical protein